MTSAEPVARQLHISSAVVLARSERAGEIAIRLQALPETEVHFIREGRIVIVLEGTSVDAIGARLAEIGAMEGVVSANLVFEQAETMEDIEGVP